MSITQINEIGDAYGANCNELHLTALTRYSGYSMILDCVFY